MIPRYTARALTEIDLAILWYEEQRRGLGADFLDCVAKAQALFDAGGYSSVEAAKAAFDNAWPFDPYLHYIQYGSAEGINPSNAFDESEYLATKLADLQADAVTSADWAGKTVDDLRAVLAAAGLSALGHYQAYGKIEGIAVTPVLDSE
jgi:S-layer protein